MTSARLAALAIAVALAATGCGGGESSDDAPKTAATNASAANVVDYDALLITADDIELPGDSFTAPDPTTAPAAPQGASTFFTNSDGSRHIGVVVAALPDADAAAMALDSMSATLPSAVTAGNVRNVDVGDRANMIAGDSFEAAKSTTVIVFQQGIVATTMQFEGPLGDPVPDDWAIALAQKQADKLAAG